MFIVSPSLCLQPITIDVNVICKSTILISNQNYIRLAPMINNLPPMGIVTPRLKCNAIQRLHQNIMFPLQERGSADWDLFSLIWRQHKYNLVLTAHRNQCWQSLGFWDPVRSSMILHCFVQNNRKNVSLKNNLLKYKN